MLQPWFSFNKFNDYNRKVFSWLEKGFRSMNYVIPSFKMCERENWLCVCVQPCRHSDRAASTGMFHTAVNRTKRAARCGQRTPDGVGGSQGKCSHREGNCLSQLSGKRDFCTIVGCCLRRGKKKTCRGLRAAAHVHHASDLV